MDEYKTAHVGESAAPSAGGELGEHKPGKPAIPLRLLLQPHGLVVELNRPETIVGRHHEANLRLPLPDVSRRHCTFLYAENAWQVCDLDSLNGVFVNNLRVAKAVLHHHDTIRIGSFVFQVDLHSGEATLELPSGVQEQFVKNIAELLPPSTTADQLNRKAS